MKHSILFIASILIFAIALSVSAQDAIGDGMYDDTYHLISQTGCTYQSPYTGYHEGTRLRCPAAATISFRFYGDEFALWALRYSGGGDVEICVDLICSTSSTLSGGTAYGEWVRFYGLTMGFHDVVMTVQSGFLFFDALWIAPVPSGGGGSSEIHQFTVNVIVVEQTPEVTPEITPEVTEPPETTNHYVEFDEEVAIFEYSMTAGDAINSGLQMVIITLVIFLIGIALWKH